MELTASAGEDACAAPCCASSPRRTVGELCERGLHRNRLEPLTIAGRALRNRDGLVAQFSLERHGGSIASVRFKASTCATLLAFCELIAELATMRNIDERAADHMLAWPKTYGLDSVLVPAVRDLIGSAAVSGSIAVQQLCAACLDHLHTRIAEPLAPPDDWRRESALSCRYPHCTELSGFLADAEYKTWTLKAAEHARAHVADTIRKAGCDLDVTTDRRGPPLQPRLHKEPGEL